MLNRIDAVQECEATDDASSTTVGLIKNIPHKKSTRCKPCT